MATTSKLVFVGSKINPSDTVGVININVLYKVDNKINLLVSIPNNTWGDIVVMYDNKKVDLREEYPTIINKATRSANKMFPNWRG